MNEGEKKDPCVQCGKPTVFGSGNFVNRIPSEDGYICPNCLTHECDRCEDPIPLDEDIWLDEQGGQRVHWECLTPKEQKNYK